MDRFGFTGDHSCIETKSTDDDTTPSITTTPSEKRAAKLSVWLENKRSLKWIAMCENWSVYSIKHHKTVKRRVRKGVPDAMRGKMWEVFSGADVLRQQAQSDKNLTYQITLDRANSQYSQIKILMDKANTEAIRIAQEEQSKSKSSATKDKNKDDAASNNTTGPSNETKTTTSSSNGVKDPSLLLSKVQKKARKWDAVIEADLGRTFPDHCMFTSGNRGSLGQSVLRDVLRAFAISHPELGYTQGMNFIVAMFLSYMPARDAYWMLTAIMDSPKWNLQNMFCDRTPAVSRLWYQFDKLLAKYVPKVSAHFKKEGMDHSMYLTKWVIPLYTRDFRFDFVVRIWDIFLQQGWKIILRVALALLKQREKVLLKMDMEGIMYYLRDLPGTVDAEATLKAAHRIKFKTKELDGYAEEFEQQGRK